MGKEGRGRRELSQKEEERKKEEEHEVEIGLESPLGVRVRLKGRRVPTHLRVVLQAGREAWIGYRSSIGSSLGVTPTS